MFEVSRRFRFSAAHRLFKYEGPCAHLHGHNYTVTVTVRAADLTDDMVLDFRQLKCIGTWIQRTLDHNTLLGEDDPLVANIRCHVFRSRPTAENIAKLLWKVSTEQLGPKYHVSSVSVEETDGCIATYIPTSAA